MRLPFEPEPIDEARERFDVALKTVYDATSRLGWNRPGQKRENTFDFDDGLRLIVSRDVLRAGEKPVVHVSASFFDRPFGRSPSSIEDLVQSRLVAISGQAVRFVRIWLSPGMVPHWQVELACPASTPRSDQGEVLK